MKIYTLIIIVVLFLIVPTLAFAQGQLIPGTGKNCDCQKTETMNKGSDCYKYCTGSYELNDIWTVVVNGANILFAIIGTVVLVMFIYGGFTFMTSAGSKERVSKGKTIIVQSIIGMAIMFLSYTIVGFVFAMLGISKNFYSTGWFS